MSRSASAPRRANSSSLNAGTTPIQTTPSTSHTFHPSPLDAILAEQGLQRYHIHPPSWRAPWIGEPPAVAGNGAAGGSLLSRSTGRAGAAGTAATGTTAAGGLQAGDAAGAAFPVFYPPRDGMEEDQMTEQVVKAGYASKAIVQAEAFSAHQHIYDKLKTTDILGNLSRLVSAVQTKAQANLPSYGPSTFRLPSRITLTDAKREAWFSDLASPSVPLSKLSRSVPHGYKGEKGLDMLAHRKVDVPRAVWFVRAFGGVEIQSLAKTRPPPVAISLYTTEFTTVVSEFIRKQLAEVVLPSTSSSGGGGSTPIATPLPAPGTPSAHPTRARSASTSSTAAAAARAAAIAAAGPGLMDEEKRKAWEGKFDYTIRLVSSLYEEALLDRPQFLRFLITLLEPSPSSIPSPTTSTSPSTMGQLPFVLLLVENHLSDVLASEPSTARLVRGCLLRLAELDNAPKSSLRTGLVANLTSLVRSAFLANPDAFIPLLPTPIYALASSSSSATGAGREEMGTRLEKLLREAGHGDADGVEEDPVLSETIRADLEELRLRRAFPAAVLAAQTAPVSSLAAPATAAGATAQGPNDRAFLAAIKRLDEIDFPAKIRDVHRTLFVSPAPPSAPPVPSPASHRMAKTASGTSSQPSSSSRARTSASTARTSITPSSSSPSDALPITLSAALPLLFTWATTPIRPAGAHRRYAVARLISLELERQSSSSSSHASKASRSSARLTAKRSGGSTSSSGVEDAFVRWVDEHFPAATAAAPTTPAPPPTGTAPPPPLNPFAAGAGAGEISKEDVRFLAEELIRAGVLNYGTYLQRMIARGETEQRDDEEGAGGGSSEPSLHVWILRTVPLASQVEAGALPGAVGGARRRVAIGGKQGIEQTLKTEERLRVVKAELGRLAFSSPPPPSEEDSVDTLLRTMGELVDDGAHWVVTRDVVPDGLSSRIDGTTQQVKVEVRQFAVVVALYEVAQDWWGLLQLLIVLLHRSPAPALLAHILDVIEAHLVTWSSLDALSELGAALFAVHTSSTSSPSPPRLLDLLVAFSSASLLSSKAQDAVESAHRAGLADTVTAQQVQQHHLTNPISELQSLLVDSSPAAIVQLASSISVRYQTYDNCATVVIDGLVQLLPRLESLEPAVSLLRELYDRNPQTLRDALSHWAAAMTPEQLISTLGDEANPHLVPFLVNLVIDGLVSAPDMLHTFALPVWRAILAQYTSVLADSQPVQLEPNVMHALDSLAKLVSAVALPVEEDDPIAAEAMVVEGAPPAPILTPASLALRQRHASRRASLFIRPHLGTIAQTLSLLVLQQEFAIAASQTDLAATTSSTFAKLGALPELQSLVVRVPKALRTSMLDGEVVKSIPRIEAFRPKLLAGVLATLKEGGAEHPANLVSSEDWDLFLSGLTLWRLAISKVEVEACLERLDLDTSLSGSDRAEALRALSEHFLERVCSGEGQSYLGEQVVKCYHGAASDELVSVSFSRLADAFSTLSRSDLAPEDSSPAFTTLRCTSRLLDTLLRSNSATSRSSALAELLKAIKLFLNQVSTKTTLDAETQQVVLHAAHLLTVALRCTTKPAEKAVAEFYRECLAPCARAATAFVKDHAHDCELSSTLLDLTSHLLFALPDLFLSSRPPTLQNLLLPSSASSIPATSASSGSLPLPLSLDLVPDSTFSRLTRLFGPISPPTLVANPWELLDTTDPSSSSSSTAVALAPRPAPPQLSNLGPIDLAAFRARVVETIPTVTALDALSVASTNSTATAVSTPFEKGLQTNFDFETPCTTLSVAARDHRRTLAVTRMLTARLDANGAAAAQAQAQAQANAQAQAAAAAAAAAGKKRNAAGEPVKQQGSPASTASSATALPPAPAGKGTKRKASTTEVVVLDSDDDEPSAGTTGGKKPAAPKAKKAKSSGAPAAAAGGRATTGGKTASKTTAGKTVKKRK